VGLPMSIKGHTIPSCAPDAWHRACCHVGFQSLVWSFLAILLFLPFGMGMFTLYHCFWKYVTLLLKGLTTNSLP
jgi:hypothetical protein